MKRRIRLDLLSLESRLVPATFGIPWADGRHLTVSFAPSSNCIRTIRAPGGRNAFPPT